MYWSREVVFLIIYASLLAPVDSMLGVPIAISVVYHLIKIHGICNDADRRWSGGRLAIMKIVIDHFHGTVLENASRIFLQGADTVVHVLLVGEMLHSPKFVVIDAAVGDRQALMHCWFAAWVLHACCNQLSAKSTATLVVELVKSSELPPLAKRAVLSARRKRRCCRWWPALSAARKTPRSTKET